MAHTLPELPYSYNALEPYYDEQTVRLHHDMHHKAYVDGLNNAEAKLLKQYGLLSSFTSKCIALSTMAIDHIGAVLLPSPKYLLLRLIGRISFPIFCFLIVEGYYRTKNLKKYILRLFAFALISEIPYDLAFKKSFIYLNKQNIFFTLQRKKGHSFKWLFYAFYPLHLLILYLIWYLFLN
jgi:hypothetical protein